MDETGVEAVVAEIDAWAARPDALYLDTFCEALGWVSDYKGMNDSLSKLKTRRNDPTKGDTGFSGSSRASEKKPSCSRQSITFGQTSSEVRLARSKMLSCRFDKPLPARLM